jgi:hypothetical protein
MAQGIDVTLDGLRGLSLRAQNRELAANDWPVVCALVGNLIAREEGKMDRMAAKAAAGATETAAETMAEEAASPHEMASAQPSSESSEAKADEEEKPAAKGHGKNGAASFSQAKHFSFSLPKNTIGFFCPDCQHAKLKRHRPKTSIRVVGQPLFSAEVYEAEQARCPGCGKVVAAQLPAGSGEGIGKHVVYDWSACAMLLVLHYTGGLPFKRLEALHESWGIPFSDANQWEVASQAIDYLQPLAKALEDHAVENARTLRIDDTGSEVVAIRRQIAAEIEAAKALGLSEKSVRAGINATCARLDTAEGTAILFFTGRHHAGEICERILRKRAAAARRRLGETAGLAPDALADKLVKVSDAAAKNFDHDQADQVVEAACNAHAFLKFHDVKEQFPAEYAVAGEAYAQIFANDALARERKMTPEERLRLHQEKSKPWMEKIRQMCAAKLQAKLIEPRSPLWGAATFFVNQWARLSKFLEVPGVPLDSNLVEQDLIVPVRYLAASFNYHTPNGAEVGDAAMSLTATARACAVEPVAYLAYCLKRHEDLKQRPQNYLPWVYRDKAKTRAPDEALIEIR